jgi:hypothetical protein
LVSGGTFGFTYDESKSIGTPGALDTRIWVNYHQEICCWAILRSKTQQQLRKFLEVKHAVNGSSSSNALWEAERAKSTAVFLQYVDQGIPLALNASIPVSLWSLVVLGP